MSLQPRRGRTGLVGALFALALMAPGLPAASEPASAVVQVARADEGSEPARGKLEPSHPPREPEKKSWYNSDYLFGMTRGVTGSTMHPAAKVPLLVLTLPLDIAFLPFAAIGGLFG